MTTPEMPVRRVQRWREQRRDPEGAPQPESRRAERLVEREWLVTNGLGGYASGTVSGVITRRYHGLLIAALPAPIGRTVMLNQLSEHVRLPSGRAENLGGEERVGSVLNVQGAQHLVEFRLELGLPVWTYDIDGTVIEKRILMPHGHNTVHVTYALLQGEGTVRLKLRPAVHFRVHEAPVSTRLEHPYKVVAENRNFEIVGPEQIPPLRMVVHGERAAFTVEPSQLEEVLYRIEASRGYESSGDLWCPGYFRADLTRERPVVLVGSVEPWETIWGLPPHAAREIEESRRTRLLRLAGATADDPVEAELVLAADQFIIAPAGRAEEAARAAAAGDDARTIIAGYHWFTDWGRDTMISLEGLTLCTGRFREGGAILKTFAHHVRDGLIPNMFPDGATQGLYHTADATLWFFHAIDRYLSYTHDEATLEYLLPIMEGVIECHVEGTRFGIHVDKRDGLLCEGAEGYQLTWMDAKCDDWVVTPRRGKAVEINALWYNALSVLHNWLAKAGAEERAAKVRELAAQARRSFNERFWYEQGGFLYDVVDGPNGNDAACRPNQIFAISLPHPVLDEARWPAVLSIVESQLLTPVGLRSLSPHSADYHRTYTGDLRTRDGAYHQGTVWAWLIGPFIDAWRRVHPNQVEESRKFLKSLVTHLDDFGVGTIAEIFDAEPPYTPRGCIAQAWSVAEVLRSWQLERPEPR